MGLTGSTSFARFGSFLAAITIAIGTFTCHLAGQTGPQTPRAFTILVTNDDGIGAPGLAALVEALRPLGRIVVAAPAKGQSGTGNTLPNPRQPLIVNTHMDQAGVAWHSIDSTPTATVLVAISALMQMPPDLVVSGINPGPNLAQAVYSSGTVGATRAAIWQGVPAISVSMLQANRQRYPQVASFTRRLVEELRASGLVEPGLFLKVSWPRGEPKGLRVTRLSERYHRVLVTPCENAAQNSCFNLRSDLPTDDDPTTDTGALAEGYVSLTPMQLDVTARGGREGLSSLEGRWSQLRGR